MKKLPMILLLIAPYLLLMVCSITGMDFSIGICAYAALLVFNMAYAFRMPKQGFEGKQILFWNMLLKLCHIPLMILIGLVVLMTSLIGGEGMADEAPTMVLIGLMVCYILQLSSAAFGFSGLLWYRKQGALSVMGMIAAMMAQLIPCVDIIGSVLCYLMLRNQGELI